MMQIEQHTITVEDCCNKYDISISFVNELEEYGLMEFAQQEGQKQIDEEQLFLLEKFIRLHYDLHVNMEGLDIIHQLLQRIDTIQAEKNTLLSRLTLIQ